MTKQSLILVLTFLLTTSFGERQKNELYLNYVAAIKNESTFQYHLVVKVKNLNTGMTREYCTQGNFLKGALHREYKLDYNRKGISKVCSLAINNKDKYFEFKNDSAILNIGGDWEYTLDELSKLENEINFDSLATEILMAGKWSKEIFDDKKILMYAHALFNRGVLTGESNCFGGTLVYVDRKNTNE